MPLSVFHATHASVPITDLDCKTVCIFVYSSTREQSNKRSRTRLKTESETGERRYGRVRLARTPRFTDFFTDFEKKTDCFAVYNAFVSDLLKWALKCRFYTTGPRALNYGP